MRTKGLALVAAATVSAFLVAGCGDDSTDSSMTGHSTGSSASASSTPVQFNDADVMFASMMYPHHAQAVAMAAMANGRTVNPEVLALASQIEAAQQPEMDQLSIWLADWNQAAPSADMSGMDHSSGTAMMTQQDMDTLTAASGPKFDRQWLTMMIAHHSGAIDMADTEISDGSNPDAQEMARTIVDTQQQEIGIMQRLLG